MGAVDGMVNVYLEPFVADVPSGLLCQECNGVVREFSIPSPLWNCVVRDQGGRDYLCAFCFVRYLWIWWYGNLELSEGL